MIFLKFLDMQTHILPNDVTVYVMDSICEIMTGLYTVIVLALTWASQFILGFLKFPAFVLHI